VLNVKTFLVDLDILGTTKWIVRW